MNTKNFDKVVNELFELSQEGKNKMLIVYDSNWELNVRSVCEKPYISNEYIVGVIDLDINNTFDYIEEAVCSLLSLKKYEFIDEKINYLKKKILNKEINGNDLDLEVQSICYSESDAYTDELIESGCISYTLLDDTDKHILIEFDVKSKNANDESPLASLLKINDISLN